jgi:hypothetical protein
MELDRVPLWRGDHVEIRQLVEDFARYLYLPRLVESSVLIAAIREGVSLLTWPKDSFAYADSFDEAAGRYRGLRGAQNVSLSAESSGLLVRPDVARRQMDEETAVAAHGAGVSSSGSLEVKAAGTPDHELGPSPTPRPRRFHGTVTLDPDRVGRDASRIAEEVIAHLTTLAGADVTVTLEIEASIPNGTPDHVVRIVTENGRTLRFRTQAFEKE